MALETVTVRGLQAAVALITAESARLKLAQADIIGDCAPEEALRALTVLAGAYMAHALPSTAVGVLRNTGTMAGRLEADGL